MALFVVSVYGAHYVSHGRVQFVSLESLPQIFYYNQLLMQSNENFLHETKA